MWEQRNPHGKASGCTSLLGKDKKILLAGLSSRLNIILRPETVSAIVKVWIEFAEIYTVVHNWDHEKDPTDFFTKAKEWIFFVRVNGKREVYEQASYPIHAHYGCTHSKLFELHKSVKIFTGQGVGKNNDAARAISLRKSKTWDSAGDVLRQEQCQWELKEHDLEVHSYTKR